MSTAERINVPVIIQSIIIYVSKMNVHVGPTTGSRFHLSNFYKVSFATTDSLAVTGFSEFSAF